MKEKSCWVARGKIALSNIIRQGRTVVHNVQLFTMAEVARDSYPQARGHTMPESVISSTEAYAVPVRLFNLSGLPANVAEPLKLETGEEGCLIPPPTSEAEPEAPVSEAGLEAQEEAEIVAQAAAVAPDLLARECERVLQEAQDEAARCLARAQEQAAALTTEAYQQGLRQGEEAARQEIIARFSPVLSAFQRVTTEVANLRIAILRQAEEDIITLAFQLTRKILQYEAREHREVLATTLKRALEHVVEQNQVMVRVHHDDLQYATELQQELRLATADIKTLAIQGDASVGRGGCIIESNLGTIDARIEAQFEELEQRFRMQRALELEARVA
jgi:flagellar assembly protein FliH